jgi:uncharacterized protein YndB with AHSA1/START domain
MIKWTLVCAAAALGLVAIVALVGACLPKAHRASRTTSLPVAPDAIFAAIADVAQYAAWRSDVTRIELLPDEGGRRMFREIGSQGTITYRIEAVDPPSRIVFRIADPSLPFGGTWTHELRPSGVGGTSLTTIEEGEVYNPIFRFVSRFFMSPTATIERYQDALARRVAASPKAGG